MKAVLPWNFLCIIELYICLKMVVSFFKSDLLTQQYYLTWKVGRYYCLTNQLPIFHIIYSFPKHMSSWVTPILHTFKSNMTYFF